MTLPPVFPLDQGTDNPRVPPQPPGWPCRHCGHARWQRLAPAPYWHCLGCGRPEVDPRCTWPIRIRPSRFVQPATWPEPLGAICASCRRHATWRADPAARGASVKTWRCFECERRRSDAA